jgi:type II secretory pathway component PulC
MGTDVYVAPDMTPSRCISEPIQRVSNSVALKRSPSVVDIITTRLSFLCRGSLYGDNANDRYVTI